MNVNLENLVITNYIIKMLFVTIFSFYTYIKITNEKIKLNIKICISLLAISIFTGTVGHYFNSFISMISLIFLIAIDCSVITKKGVGYSILISIISASYNYILFFGAVIIDYVINKIHTINSDFINLCLIIIIQFLLLYKTLKIKKLKNGISFFYKNSQDDYFDVIILNISVSLLLTIIIFPYVNLTILRSLLGGFIISAIIMIITIYRTWQLYYKHKLLVKELEETKLELENAKEENKKLEKDNLNISQKIHTLAHDQESLEYQVGKLTLKSESAEEINLKEKVEKLSKEVYEPTYSIEIAKTGIDSIDNRLEYMKSKCDEHNIEFTLQILGNIYYMVNNIITKEELATLISDHVKDAIIAINHSDNINKSILVKLGKIDENYGLYIYDSGIEFEEETLKHLGKIPYTTHKDEGGTGLGFMNTFETLHKYKASLTINEIGKPSKENYTKIVMIKFDNKDEFNVISYK